MLNFDIADSRGVGVWSSDSIAVDGPDGTKQEVPWSIATYIQLSNVKYRSKARFYCVKKGTRVMCMS